MNFFNKSNTAIFKINATNKYPMGSAVDVVVAAYSLMGEIDREIDR